MVHVISLVAIAIGLSMDAFSLAILYGTLNFTKRKTLYLSSSVGVFHFFMPLLGNLIGIFILSILPIQPNTLVGIIFFIISIQMIVSLFKAECVVDMQGIISVVLFAFTVSIDSFSVGIGLSAVCNNKILASIIFSTISFLFTFTGISIGSKLTERFGNISTFIGSIILLLLSFCYLFLYNV